MRKVASRLSVNLLISVVVILLLANVLVVEVFASSPISIAPTSGNWNFTPSFIVKNEGNTTITNMSYLLDCWEPYQSNGVCSDTVSTVTLAPGDSVTLGLGLGCYKWQLDLFAPHNQGYIVEVGQNSCQTATPTPTASATPAPTMTPSPVPTVTPVVTPTPTDGPRTDLTDGRSDGRGCSVNDCSGNQIPTGGVVAGVSTETLPSTGQTSNIYTFGAFLTFVMGIAMVKYANSFKF